MHGPTNIDALLRHLAHRVDKAKQELAQLRQAKTDQGNNDDLEATDVTSTTTGDSNTPDDAKAHGSCGVIDMSSNNWFPEYSSNVESPHRSSIEAPREVNMTRKTRTTSTVDLSLSDPIHCNDERMRSLQLENQRLLQQNVELDTMLQTTRQDLERCRASLCECKVLYDKEAHRSRLQALALTMLQDELHLQTL
ncbi:hypothetical protein, variant 1 [Aphanomyces astaci]|uniref:Uncharacterized protein n=1 Tax=Aphanomyces astaci TaxID=112090 RepID=W4G7V9_APHAT|nr:hypothetical protein, variant 1 [Aphanomyces astaci]ETV75119.1 hypothetical protein, variant 1 [Aphanomyces astaci]|eukprot:XP_009835622.1 hypothetical protein, variant 1 [Aphanomyces astaci]